MMRWQKPKYFTHNPLVFHRSSRQLKPLLSAWSIETKTASSVLSTWMGHWVLKDAHVWKLGSGIKVPAFICEFSLLSHRDSSHNTLLKYIWIKFLSSKSSHLYLNFSTAVLTQNLQATMLQSCWAASLQSSFYYGPQTSQLEELLVHLTALIVLRGKQLFWIISHKNF